MEYKINRGRLEKNLYELAEIGKNATGGIDRFLSSKADQEAREWILDYWKTHLDTTITIDGIANMWALAAGEEDLPPIVFGSHHDAVPNGGMFDGALGVLLATEILETLQENGVKTKHPFEVVSFTGEEPNPFNVSTLGSKVLSGRLVTEDLEKLSSYLDGSSLQDCMKKIGGNLEKTKNMKIKEGQIRAFLECHIEQGSRLIDKGLTTSAVSCITGIYRENVEVVGEANHAGTTIMQKRHDALNAASEFSLAFEQMIEKEQADDIVGTIGYFNIFPNSANIIPGKVTLTLEMRTCDEKITQRLARELDEICQRIEAKRGVKIKRTVNLDQKEMPLDEDVQKYVLEAMEELGEGQTNLVSMAGHDAANMQRVTKSGMIFTQSEQGKSHCPDEFTSMDAIEKTGNCMLLALLKMDQGLD